MKAVAGGESQEAYDTTVSIEEQLKGDDSKLNRPRKGKRKASKGKNDPNPVILGESLQIVPTHKSSEIPSSVVHGSDRVTRAKQVVQSAIATGRSHYHGSKLGIKAGDSSIPSAVAADILADEAEAVELVARARESGGLFASALSEIVKRSAWTQNVVAPTRYRVGQIPSLLDLVITKERHFDDQVTINAPLGHSDHCVLTFDFICYWARNPKPQTWFRDFCRADFSRMRIFLEQVTLGPAPVEELYRTIVQKVHEADATFVPRKPARTRMNRRLPKRIRRLLKKRSQLFFKKLTTGDREDELAFRKMRNRYYLIKRSEIGVFSANFPSNRIAPAFCTSPHIMTFYDSFLRDVSFVDSLTHTNLMLFILLREYILSVRLGQSMFDDSVDGTPKMRMYMYFYDLLRYYAAHLLAIRKRNISEAVDNLCSYFETRMASEWSDKGLKNTCAYMAVASANMHLSFGHWLRGKCLEKEALKKSLESESGASLNHLKITHSLLNTDTASFRYDSQIPQRIINRMPVVPSLLQLACHNAPGLFFNVSARYSYTVVTLWLPCVINADCLQPCPMSDAVLSTAFAGMIKEFSAAGAVNEALNLANCVETVICRFSEKSTIHQARLQVELEQALRSGVDLAQCDRLVNALRLCCPWEAALYQAEVERLRGNCVTSHDLLQHVVQSALSRLKSATIKTSGAADSSSTPPNSSITFHVEPFSHLSIPVFDQHVPLGGIARLAQIAVRAQLALVELLMSMQLCAQADQILDEAQSLAVQYRLCAAANKVCLLKHALHTLCSAPSSEPSVELDRVLCEALHQSDHSTQWRCLTYASRLRLRTFRSSTELGNCKCIPTFCI
ncbi:hypothetical protein T265_05477 [Opisthorchis viverrini]|uniref:Uncharacterized protein n=1 Tax=Opisthorchis viverrini TaxID=6198 RepID=A0A074ZJJ3_OPIVI|nr:hypothetical protein T265_05477 [Opisthorchis viverrini]KER27518.1 hypothetical protein T265_05477 [Opisthorchis viverrini]